MIFTETKLKGAFVIELEPIQDERGFFARTWCRKEFETHGLNPNLVQCNTSFNKKKGTLRGMHYQTAPHEEAKLIRCTMGAVYDVIIDLRIKSATFKEWFSLELTSTNRKSLYFPEGVAHGFLTLVDNSEVFYQMSVCYNPECASGIRWNDPAFAITWPDKASIISEQDKDFQDFIL